MSDGATLTLDDGARLTDSVSAAGITVDTNGTLILDVASISGGKLVNSGTIEVQGTPNTLDGVTVTNNAAIEVSGNATLTLDDGTTITNVPGAATIDGTITVDGTLTLDDTSAITGGVVTIDSGGTLNVDFSTGGDDTMTASAGGTVVIASESLGEISGAAFGSDATVTATGGTLTVEDGSSFGNDATITTTGAGTVLTVTGASTFGDFASVTASGASSLTIEGGSSFAASDSVSAAGASTLTIDDSTFGSHITIGASGGSSLTIEGGASFSDDDALMLSSGTVTVDATAIVGFGTLSGSVGAADILSIEAKDGTLDITGLTTGTVTATVDALSSLIVGAAGHIATFSSAANAGTIEVAAGTLDITGAVTAAGSPAVAGSLQIDGGATLELGSTDAETVAFQTSATPATLQLDTLTGFTGDITGYAPGDVIDLRGVGYGLTTTSGIYTVGPDELTVTDGTNTQTIKLVGDYSNDFFVGSSDSHGGTFVTLSTVDAGPVVTATSGTSQELTGQTSDSIDHDTAAGTISFTDVISRFAPASPRLSVRTLTRTPPAIPYRPICPSRPTSRRPQRHCRWCRPEPTAARRRGPTAFPTARWISWVRARR